MFKWESGRQETGYQKMTLIRFLFFDLYLLKYPEDSFIEKHFDKVPNRKHFRLNFVVKKSEGGEFICPNAFLNTSRLKFFRPDVQEHSVAKITKGTRYVVSLGWILP